MAPKATEIQEYFQFEANNYLEITTILFREKYQIRMLSQKIN